MRANVKMSQVAVVVAALGILLGAVVADRVLLSPILGQESGGDPLPNEETKAGCQSHSSCNMHCDNNAPPCLQQIKGVSTCSTTEPVCAKCVCTAVPGTPPICQCK